MSGLTHSAPIKEKQPKSADHIAQQEACPTRIAAVMRGGAYHAIALESIRADDVVLAIDGALVDRPDQYSVQVGKDLHVTLPPGVARHDDPHCYRWRYLNHSCRPNATFRGRLLVAIADIAEGDEVTFDYNTTELDMSVPFRCHCGHCGGDMIRGFLHLSRDEQRRREPFLADHLRTQTR